MLFEFAATGAPWTAASKLEKGLSRRLTWKRCEPPRKVAVDIRTGSLRRLWHEARAWGYPPTPPATRFTCGLNVPVPTDGVAREILEEAQELFKIPLARGEAAERRATTLQGAVAIAATFSLAAGSLLAEADKVHSQLWRVVFAVVLALIVFCFVVAGVVGLQATSKISAWQDPADERRFAERADASVAEAQMARANELLVTYGQNHALAEWKIKRATLAARWFRAALGLLLLLAVLFFCYVAPWWFWLSVLLLGLLSLLFGLFRFWRVPS